MFKLVGGFGLPRPRCFRPPPSRAGLVGCVGRWSCWPSPTLSACTSLLATIVGQTLLLHRSIALFMVLDAHGSLFVHLIRFRRWVLSRPCALPFEVAFREANPLGGSAELVGGDVVDSALAWHLFKAMCAACMCPPAFDTRLFETRWVARCVSNARWHGLSTLGQSVLCFHPSGLDGPSGSKLRWLDGPFKSGHWWITALTLAPVASGYGAGFTVSLCCCGPPLPGMIPFERWLEIAARAR